MKIRYHIAIAALAALTMVGLPLVSISHRWYGAERHQDLHLDVDCYGFRASSNRGETYVGFQACVGLLDAITHDDSAAYMVVPITIAEETDWLEALCSTVALTTILAELLRLSPLRRSAVNRLATQADVVAAVFGVFALNSATRLARGLASPADQNGRTDVSLAPGLFIIITLPLVALAAAAYTHGPYTAYGT